MPTKKKTIAAPEEVPTHNDAPAETSYKVISLDLIDDPEQPMRTDMTEASVEDLVLSMKQVGLIEPIVVKRVDGRYEVIAGHRRTFAARIAKIVEVPCTIRRANSEQTEMLKIHENLYRADVRPADEAKHFDYLIKKHKLTPEKIAQLISKAESYVYDRLAILNYPDFLWEAMNDGSINFGVAREFARFGDINQMRRSVYYAKRGGMTTEMARKWVQDFKRSKENNTIQSIPPVAGTGENQAVEHTAICVYCKEGLRLLEAQVVYMHEKCLHEVNTPPSQTVPAS